MIAWHRVWSFIPRPSEIGSRLKGAVTLMAFTDSGWMRRFRVPKLALTILAAALAGLTLVTIVSVSFAVWARTDLRRLSAVERENRSLTSQLQDQASRLGRLQSEMSRLRELEKSLRAVSGLADLAEASQPGGQGGGRVPTPPR